MYQHAQNKQHQQNSQQQHIYNQYQQQQQNFYHMSQPHSHSNSNNLSTFNNHLNNHANNSNNQNALNANHSSNHHQNNKNNKNQKQDNQQNAKSNDASKQVASEIEKKLLHYIPSLIHDLRNPLQQLVACIELYKLQLNQMQNPLYEILLHSVTHMNELITKSLTTFKRIAERQDDNQICEFQFQSIDISKYLEEFWTNNLAIAEQKPNVDYQILVQSTLPHYVNIPKLEVTQVIQNIFSNATKFTEKGSIKLIVSFHEMPEDDNIFCIQGQQENSTPPSNQHEETQNNCKKNHIDHSQINKHLDCGKESSPLDQDVSIAIEGQQKSHFQQQNEHLDQNEVRQQTMSLGNRVSVTAYASNQKPQFSSATHLPNLQSKEMHFVMLQQKLQSITYQFDKLKYSQKQDNDYQLNTEEDVEEDYSESENNLQNAHFAHSYSSNQKTIDEYYEYYQNNSLNPHNQHSKLNYNGQQNKKLLSQYNFSTQSYLNSHKPNKQSNNNANNNGSTPNNQNANAIGQENNQNNIHSFNQIENSNTSSTSRSCHNSTPPTFQIHTFSDIQNPRNTNQQHSDMIKSQQLTSFSKQNTGENDIAGTNQTKQYHTPQMSSKNDFYSSKNQVFNQKSQQNMREQKNKNFFIECPSPETASMNSQSKNDFQARDNIHSFYSDVNPEVKNLPGSADLEGQQKSMKLSAVMKQQQMNKQNKVIGQGCIQNSYYYNCQQKQTSQSSGDLRSIKNQFFVGAIHNPALSQQPKQQKPKEQLQPEDHINGQHNHNKSNHSQNYEKPPNNKEYCQIFSKRKSQIHPSIRDLVFNRNNIRNFQIRQVAKIKGYLKFEILDTGKGMDEIEQKKIFNIYQQANNSIKEHYGGSGIGLYSAKNIANQLNGDIYCHSQKGVGSAFIFYMPCTAAYKTESNEEDSRDQFQFESIQDQNFSQKNQMNENEHIQDKTQLIITKTTSQTKKSAYSNQFNLGNGQQKYNQDKQQQFQISQIKQGLKIADPLNQNLDQQNKLVLTKQQQTKLNQSPAEKKEEEIKFLISKLEEKKKKIRVIYIDDSQFLLEAMEMILSKIKCVESIVEKNPLKALQTIKQNPQKFDIALIDHEMPELDGNKLASEIRLINSNIKLICQSGQDTTSEFTKDCIQSGFSYFLQKPFYLENIVVLICKIYHIDLDNLKYINISDQPFNIL
ncbi:hypothetical protein ABPG72_020172 [Tetrahymena utriculariae]